MDKSEVLSEMKAAPTRYETIPEPSFDFSKYEGDCGTKCCLWGWEPSFEDGFEVEWEKQEAFFEDRCSISVDKIPYAVLEWPYELVSILYMPHNLDDATNLAVKSLKSELSRFYDAPLGVVEGSSSLKFWKDVIYALERSDRFDYMRTTPYNVRAAGMPWL